MPNSMLAVRSTRAMSPVPRVKYHSAFPPVTAAKVNPASGPAAPIPDSS
jgi:hypothetical protein